MKNTPRRKQVLSHLFSPVSMWGFYCQEIDGEMNNMTEQNITPQTPTTPTVNDWIAQEKAELGTQTETVYDKLPAMKFEENKIIEFTVDLSEKFQTYDTTNMKGEPVKKAIIPVLHNGEKKNLWLNKKNPLYREILDMGEGKKTIIMKVMQTGSKQNTKYIVVK